MRAPLAALLALALAAPAAGQPVAFGSAQDPLERGALLGPRDRAAVYAVAGPAYLPDTWRTAVRLAAEGRRGRWSLAVGGTVHPGAGGLYGPEADEAYDALRLLRYARLNPTPTSPLYARVGPIENVRLGSGALVRGFRTTTAWDERTVGVEGAVAGRTVHAAAFTGDVRLNGIVGGEVRVRTGLDVGPVQGLGLTLAAVHDLGRPGLTGDSALTGVEAVLRGTVTTAGPFAVAPFVTHARYLGHGQTVGAGVDAGSENLGDVLGARARLALFVSSDAYVPGYVGPFYGVNGGPQRIVDDETFFDGAPGADLVGTPLDSLGGGVDVVLDLRLVAFGRAEVSQHIRRHIGPEDASAYAVRLAGRLPGGGRAEFALEREGFRGFFDLISNLGDQNTLVLDLALPIRQRGFVFVRSRYGYRRLDAVDGVADVPGEPDRYLVERRFEPLVGLRVVVD